MWHSGKVNGNLPTQSQLQTQVSDESTALEKDSSLFLFFFLKAGLDIWNLPASHYMSFKTTAVLSDKNKKREGIRHPHTKHRCVFI